MQFRSWTGLALAALLMVTGQAQASEPSSVYLRCTMTPEQYANAMAAAPRPAISYGDWQKWFDSKDMYGSARVDAQWLQDSGARSLQEVVQIWAGQGSASHYDPRTGRWQFALLEFTDNYGEMIQLLAPLRGVAAFCQPDSDSFLFIYSYIWGDGDNAYLALDQGRSRFAGGPTAAQRAEADAALEGLMASGAD
ncbi:MULTISPECIES: hypothetical protein [unclassified Pseudomonas]|uniref:hypothetical protein n=1 Tax=unclassified Pseudomonas TaxID=196821 RepID=UPI0008397C83|nr:MULTISPECIES: hypothetical protein [unclassified Pseudomonas]QIH05692.1 hypothetical protein ATY02_02935 [Pseudomonas sp. BIOMIG1BAC]